MLLRMSEARANHPERKRMQDTRLRAGPRRPRPFARRTLRALPPKLRRPAMRRDRAREGLLRSPSSPMRTMTCLDFSANLAFLRPHARTRVDQAEVRHMSCLLRVRSAVAGFATLALLAAWTTGTTSEISTFDGGATDPSTEDPASGSSRDGRDGGSSTTTDARADASISPDATPTSSEHPECVAYESVCGSPPDDPGYAQSLCERLFSSCESLGIKGTPAFISCGLANQCSNVACGRLKDNCTG